MWAAAKVGIKLVKVDAAWVEVGNEIKSTAPNPALQVAHMAMVKTAV